MTPAIEFLGEHRNLLGESPLWDSALELLWWVDSAGRHIRRARADGGSFAQWDTPSMIGSIGLAEVGLIAALEDGFHLFDPTAGGFEPIALPEADNASVRFNDGKADRQGRYLSGTMRFGGATGSPGTLYRLDHDGSADMLETDIAVSNAICFSPEGATLYFADSARHAVWAYDYDVETGTVSNRRVLIDTAPLGSPPDGATVDAEGNLWIALVLGQSIACVSPTGALLRRIELPVPFPSCPAFGGDDLSTLFVTTISESRPLLVSDHADAGRMLTITGLGVVGIAETRCIIHSPERV